MARRRPRRPRKLTRQQRQRRFFDREALYNPTVQLSGWRLQRAAGQLTDYEFRPQRAELSRQLSSVGTQGGALLKRTGDYYHQLASEEAQGLARQSALSGQTNRDLAGIAGQTQGQITQAQQQAQQAGAQDAAQRGQGLGGGDQLAQEIAAARANAAQSAQAYRSTGALQGANYQGLAASMRGSRQLRGGEVLGGLANRIASAQGDIRSKQQQLEGQYGPALTKHLLDLRQQGFENIATQEGLGLKGQQLQADISKNQAEIGLAKSRIKETSRANRARERIAQINAKIAAGNLSERQRHNLTTERLSLQKFLHPRKPGGGGGGGGHSKKWSSDYHKAASRIRLWHSGRPWTSGILDPGWRQRVFDALVSSGLDSNAVHAALGLMRRRAHRGVGRTITRAGGKVPQF